MIAAVKLPIPANKRMIKTISGSNLPDIFEGFMTKVYVIRHCEAEGNRERRFQGTFDGEVSALGAKQLDYLALRFRNEPIDAIFSSSRKRAIATAEAVNRYHQLPVNIDDTIMEIHAGLWEGKLFSDFPVLFPKQMYDWDNEPENFVAPEGESMRSVYDRMKNFLLRIASEYPNKTVVIVSHGCAIRNLLCFVEGGGIEALKKQLWCANTAVNEIEIDEDFSMKLIKKNDISHLPEEIRSLSSQKWNHDE